MPVAEFRDVAEAARAINGILAPTIMISASALIILALQGKYSQLIDRLRALNDERRSLSQALKRAEKEKSVSTSEKELSSGTWPKRIAGIATKLVVAGMQRNVVSAISLLQELNEERLRLSQTKGSENVRSTEPQPSAKRLSNVIEQITIILLRARLVRNSIVSLYIAISLFVLSSIVIGVRLALGIRIPIGPSLIAFMLGMICVLIGTLYALRDIAQAYTVARIEVRGVGELDKKK